MIVSRGLIRSSSSRLTPRFDAWCDTLNTSAWSRSTFPVAAAIAAELAEFDFIRNGKSVST